METKKKITWRIAKKDQKETKGREECGEKQQRMRNRKEEEKNKVSSSLELKRKEHDGCSKKLGRKKTW